MKNPQIVDELLPVQIEGLLQQIYVVDWGEVGFAFL